jgi:hypothetical protein
MWKVFWIYDSVYSPLLQPFQSFTAIFDNLVVDGLDIAASHVPALADPARSLDADSPIVLLDATTGERHPFWAELDAIADVDEQALLTIHPAVNFADGHRIVVGLRNLVDAQHDLANEAFPHLAAKPVTRGLAMPAKSGTDAASASNASRQTVSNTRSRAAAFIGGPLGEMVRGAW